MMTLTDFETTRLLAAKVLGLEEVQLPVAGDPLSEVLGPRLAEPRKWFSDRRAVGLVGDGKLVYPWEPLDNIRDAWEVRDRLAERGVFRVENSEAVGVVRCQFLPFYVDGNMPADLQEAIARERCSTPRAICLCALRAVGVESVEPPALSGEGA